MSKKILIIGFGKMGKSHLQSFLNSKKKYIIDILDLKKIIKKEKKQYQKKVFFLSEFPNKKKYHLVIVATSSKVRYSILIKLLKLNIVKKIVLEKFIFNKVSQYLKFNKLLYKNNNLNIGVNTWGHYLYKRLKISIKNNKKQNIKVQIPEGSMLTTFVHYADFFLKKNEEFEILLNFNKIFLSKRSGYSEALGKIIVKSKSSQMLLSTYKKKYAQINYFKEKYKIVITENRKFAVYFNNKIIQKINFPYASQFSEKIYMKDNKDILNYKKIANISRHFLEKIEFLYKNKKISIT